jgi:hypothetical protein
MLKEKFCSQFGIEGYQYFLGNSKFNKRQDRRC